MSMVKVYIIWLSLRNMRQEHNWSRQMHRIIQEGTEYLATPEYINWLGVSLSAHTPCLHFCLYTFPCHCNSLHHSLLTWSFLGPHWSWLLFLSEDNTQMSRLRTMTLKSQTGLRQEMGGSCNGWVRPALWIEKNKILPVAKLEGRRWPNWQRGQENCWTSRRMTRWRLQRSGKGRRAGRNKKQMWIM